MRTEKPFEPVSRLGRAGRLVWTLTFLISMLGLSCTAVHPQREALSEYYWDVQNLRMRIGKSSTRAQALRDLGVIYLRTGHFEEAHGVLARSLAQDRSDPKLWFYTGLSQELLDKTEAALATYERSPSLSASSIYSRAMKGRIAWLQDEKTRLMLEELLAREPIPSSDSLSPAAYAVFPFVCQGGLAEYGVLGKGLSDLISRDLGRLRGIKVVDPYRVKRAVEITSAVRGQTEGAGPIQVGQRLGVGKIIEGRCIVGTDNSIEVDLVLHDLIDNRVISVSAEGRLENVFLLEESIIDGLVDTLRIWLPNRDRRIQVPPSGLDALMAYSQGLEHEEAGQLEQSAVLYQQALTLYPRFTLAGTRSETVENKILARGTDKEDLVDLLVRLESFTVTPYMLDTRIQNLGSSLGSGFVPGPDTRKLPPGNVGELPAPPRPVDNQ